jgi:ferritin
MQNALCEQINAELYSAYLYLSMVSYFDSLNLQGASHWMRIQVQEELSHVVKLFDYVHERGGRVTLTPIAGPPTDWDSPLAAFEHAYRHECEVTARINKLVDLSLELSDHASNNMLQWFVAEQVEEEASVDEIVQQLKLVGGEGHGLFMVDRELAGRPMAASVTAAMSGGA